MGVTSKNNSDTRGILHHEIFESISLRDVELAKESIKPHIKAGKEYIFSIIFD